MLGPVRPTLSEVRESTQQTDQHLMFRRWMISVALGIH